MCVIRFRKSSTKVLVLISFVNIFFLMAYFRQSNVVFYLITSLYGCETWSFIMRETHRLPVLENRVVRKKFAPKKYEIIGE